MVLTLLDLSRAMDRRLATHEDGQLARLSEHRAVTGPDHAVLLEEALVDDAGLDPGEAQLVWVGVRLARQRHAEVDRQVDGGRGARRVDVHEGRGYQRVAEEGQRRRVDRPCLGEP